MQMIYKLFVFSTLKWFWLFIILYVRWCCLGSWKKNELHFTDWVKEEERRRIWAQVLYVYRKSFACSGCFIVCLFFVVYLTFVLSINPLIRFILLYFVVHPNGNANGNKNAHQRTRAESTEFNSIYVNLLRPQLKLIVL